MNVLTRIFSSYKSIFYILIFILFIISGSLTFLIFKKYNVFLETKEEVGKRFTKSLEYQNIQTKKTAKKIHAFLDETGSNDTTSLKKISVIFNKTANTINLVKNSATINQTSIQDSLEVYFYEMKAFTSDNRITEYHQAMVQFFNKNNSNNRIQTEIRNLYLTTLIQRTEYQILQDIMTSQNSKVQFYTY